MKHILWAAATFAGSLHAGHAFAVVDAQVMGGARTATVEYKVNDEDRKKDVKSTELGFAAHVSPSKVLPVSFGVFGNMNKYDATPIVEEQVEEEPGQSGVFTDPKSSITGMTYGPELMAWVPIPMFKPFLRASYVMGNYDYTTSSDYAIGALSGDLETSLTYKASGYDVGVGFIYSPVPVLGLVVEYNLGSETLTATKGKVKTNTTVGAASAEDEDDINLDDLEDSEKTKTIGSSAIRLGLSLSL